MKGGLFLALLGLSVGTVWGVGPSLNVRDFGAVGDGRADDTEAFQKAFVAAQKHVISFQPQPGQAYVYSLPELYIPNGRYRLSAPLTPTCHLQGEGNAILEAASEQMDIIRMENCWRWRVRGLTFLGGRDQLQIGNNNLDTGRIIIEDCLFQNATGCAVRLGEKTYSTQLTIRNCVFYSCRQVLVNRCDLAKLADSWITTAAAMREQAVIENYGILLLENLLGVPSVVPANDQRWIDNFGGVICRAVRFGGEDGGFCIVVNRVRYDYTYPVIPSFVILEGCQIYALNNPRRRCAIYLEEVPNQIIVRDCVGFPDLPVVQLDARIEPATYFREAEARGEACLRFYIDPAQVELRLRELPEPLRKYEIRYGEEGAR